MIVITSAAYVGQEFQAELGKIPPAMLPIGNSPLFEHQVKALQSKFSGEDIYLSLPGGYEVHIKDKCLIDSLNVKVILVPEEKTLAGSLLYVLNSITHDNDKLRVLHGDTFITDFPEGDNLLGVAETHDDYNWEVEKAEGKSELVWCGYFAFNNINSLVKHLAGSQGDFVEAIHQYDKERILQHRNISSWYDFGHVNTYFKSRAKITTQRGFNTLNIENGCVFKTGKPKNKIQAEGLWFKNLPIKLKANTPQLIGQGVSKGGEPYYILEYLCILPLNELYVHGRNTTFFWTKVFKHCNNFFKNCITVHKEESKCLNSSINFDAEAHMLIADKTWKRLNQYALDTNTNLDIPTKINGKLLPSINEIVNDCINITFSEPPVIAVLHGDFCLSNLLFDNRADLLKVIDPRAIDAEGNFSMLGDLRYDVAKLNHSIIGLYDFIIAGAFQCIKKDDLDFELKFQLDKRIKKIQEIYLEYSILQGQKTIKVMPITILLFFAMLPLHADRPDRQIAFIANALRLYADYMFIET